MTFSGNSGNLVALTAGSTFTGGVTFDGGINFGGSPGDAAFGDASNVITMNGGGTNGNLGANNLSTGRSVVVTAAGTIFDGNNSQVHRQRKHHRHRRWAVRIIERRGSSNPVVLTGNNSYAGVNLSNSGGSAFRRRVRRQPRRREFLAIYVHRRDRRSPSWPTV